MRRIKVWGYTVATMLAAAGVTLTAPAAQAADFTQSFPAGVTCSFALNIAGTGGNDAVRHDANGLTVSGGTGSSLTFKGNGRSVSFPSNGAVTITRTNPDGSSIEQLTGHNVVILFPTDNPPGPSTKLIVGRAVIAVDLAGNFDVLSVSGSQTNICALLS